jgi:regulator of cell morphogenesis and NO signaling
MNRDMTVGEIVAKDCRAASVFNEVGIDFCCGGKKSIDESFSEKGINRCDLLGKLEKLETNPDTGIHNYIDWEPAFLCDYIVNTHHKYVKRSLPELLIYTEKIADVHGERLLFPKALKSTN